MWDVILLPSNLRKEKKKEQRPLSWETNSLQELPDSPWIKEQLLPVTDLQKHCLRLDNNLQRAGAFLADI